ncbi:VWA domain-containing protein [Nesterenkonia haasae]|uniref:VWA domain-containing protein n=1 Tax=Nesterenkonia haasae TaxID=2587813 RepID=UPI0013916C55|nr:VWA domain-containing protein [Nesterenkonia haasae]NDK31438.1 VWA domain-containing protein [Nesterenkonia haasae]
MTFPTALSPWLAPERFTMWGPQGQARSSDGHHLQALAWDAATIPPRLCVIEADLGDDASSEEGPDPSEQPADSANDAAAEGSDNAGVESTEDEPPEDDTTESEATDSETVAAQTLEETDSDQDDSQSDASNSGSETGDPSADAERSIAVGKLNASADRLELTLGEEGSAPAEVSGLMAVLEQHRSEGACHRHLRGRAGIQALSVQRGRKVGETVAVTGVPVSIPATIRRATRRHGSSGVLGQIQLQDSDLQGARRRRPSGAHTVVLVDGSSSLGQEGLSATSRAVDHTVGHVASRRGVVSVVIAAGSAARTLVERGSSPARARRALHRVSVGGGTPLAHGVGLALELLRADDPGQRRLLMITDGHPTVGLSGAHTPLDEAWEELSQLLERAVEFCEDVSVLPVGIYSDRVLTRNMGPFHAAGVGVGSLLV